ncbi:MAG: rod shape-determining protein MreC [Betaproteobacteria bacterium]
MSAYQENFFTRGPSPLARLTFFSLIAIAVMVADHRFQALGWVRMGVSAVLSPIEFALHWPTSAIRKVSVYFDDQQVLVAENRDLKEKLLQLSSANSQAMLLRTEQSQIEALKGAAKRFAEQGQIAEIIRDARNPYARKIVIDKGTRDGIAAGRAVIDGAGVVGQVTAVGLLTAEVTLTTEKNQSVPVMVLRNGLRAVAVGAGRDGTIDVPFIPVGADIQTGDQLVTSGIDGTYPAGLSVATISVVDKNTSLSFARIVALPVASAASHRLVKVLTHEELAAYPKPDLQAEEKKALPSGRQGRRVPAEKR